GRWPWKISADERERCMQSLKDVGIENLADRQLGSLSGGEMQRVYVARVLVRRAALVLLDEPATGMDVAAEKDLSHLLEDYQRETQATILMISHDWDTAQHHASHVLLLNRQVHWFGATEDGPSEEAMRNAFGHIGHSHPMQHAGNHENCDHD
ncbi:MAG: ATP-binding cassette domain-containing protein, partial [Planctomycetes bacterium]|nr:ATP-binding cassette domain-containing protein [Planctomycetota bacterium]